VPRNSGDATDNYAPLPGTLNGNTTLYVNAASINNGGDCAAPSGLNHVFLDDNNSWWNSWNGAWGVGVVLSWENMDHFIRGGRHTQGVLLRRAYMALWHVEEIFLLRLLRWADEIQAVIQTLEERGGDVADPCAPPPLPFSRLKSSPAGATIHYMTAIDWDVLSLWKKDPIESMEKSSDDMLEVPAGVYVVKAVWPTGETVGPTRLRIDGEHIMVKPTD